MTPASSRPGPKWVLTDRFDIQATIPAGAPEHTPQQLQDAAAPELQTMLLSLVAERFKLVLHRGTKDMQVYELALARGGPRLARADADKSIRETFRLDPDENNETLVHIISNKASLTDLAHLLGNATPVIDQTALPGEFSFDIKFAVLDPSGGRIEGVPWLPALARGLLRLL